MTRMRLPLTDLHTSLSACATFSTTKSGIWLLISLATSMKRVR